MNCSSFFDSIVLRSGGDLDLTRAGELEQHLVVCASCAAVAASFANSRDALDDCADSQPVDLWKSIEPHLNVIDASRRIRRPWYRPRIWSTAAAALLLLGGGWWVYPSGLPPAPSSDATVAGIQPEQQQPGSELVANGPAGLEAVPHAELVEFLGRNSAVLHQPGIAPALLATPATSSVREF